jgi:hypothetical protein
VAALAVLAVNEIAFQLADRALDNVQARHNARNEGLKLRELLTDAETAQRGYLLTGRDDYLAPLQLATRELPAVLQRLRSQYASSGGRRWSPRPAGAPTRSCPSCSWWCPSTATAPPPPGAC